MEVEIELTPDSDMTCEWLSRISLTPALKTGRFKVCFERIPLLWLNSQTVFAPYSPKGRLSSDNDVSLTVRILSKIYI
jgi:hypothetical protein